MSVATRAALRVSAAAAIASADAVIAAVSANSFGTPAAFEAAANEVREAISDLIPQLATEWGVDATALIRTLRTLAARLLDLRSAVSAEHAAITWIAPHTTSCAQIAAERYGDVERWTELVALNPHIRHPGFIVAGTELTLYVV